MSQKLAGFAAAGIALAACFTFSSAFAGDNNQANLLQNGSGNTLYIDQSGASNSVAGLQLQPLQQLGNDNMATIIIGGNKSSTLGSPNAALLQGSDGLSSGNNIASINLVGLGSGGSVTQKGSQNQAYLTAIDGAQGAIQQIGSGNLAGLKVSGSPLSVTFTQQGDNLTAGSKSTPIAITTNTTIPIPGLPTNASTAGHLPAIVITQH